MNNLAIKRNNAGTKFKRKRKVTRKWPLPTQTAKLKVVEAHAGETATSSAIKSRIRKCLDLGNHEKTLRPEAEKAVRNAHRMMSRHNVSHSDLYSESSNQEDDLRQAGSSVVYILRAQPGDCRKTTRYKWVQGIAGTMNLFFECKHYTEASKSQNRYSFIFYGIEMNAMAAAFAFEMVHNLAYEWARPKGGKSKGSYLLGVSDGLYVLAKRERNREEKEAAETEERRMKDNIKMEDKQRREALKRLDHPPEQDLAAAGSSTSGGSDIANIRGIVHENSTPDPESPANGYDNSSNYDGSYGSDTESEGYSDGDTDAGADCKSAGSSDVDSDDESAMMPTFEESDCDDIDLDEDFGEQSQKQMECSPCDIIKQEDGIECVDLTACSDDDSKPTSVGEAVKPCHENENLRSATKEGSGWDNPWQLIKFRDDAARIADKWMKSQDIKLRTRRKSKVVVRDWEAHKAGVKDSEKIDLKRKRVEGGNVQLLK